MTVQDNQDGPQRRPDRQLAAVLPDQDAVQQMLDDLTGLGIDLTEVAVLHGPRGVEVFDVTGQNHGRWAHLVRSWKNLGGVDADLLGRYEKALETGRSVVLLPVSADHPRAELVEVLLRRGAGYLAYFAHGAVETVA